MLLALSATSSAHREGNVGTEGVDRGPYVPVAALHGPSQVQAQILLS